MSNLRKAEIVRRLARAMHEGGGSMTTRAPLGISTYTLELIVPEQPDEWSRLLSITGHEWMAMPEASFTRWISDRFPGRGDKLNDGQLTGVKSLVGVPDVWLARIADYSFGTRGDSSLERRGYQLAGIRRHVSCGGDRRMIDLLFVPSA